MPINLAPCETVTVQIDISDSPPAYPYLSFTMYDAVGDSIYSNAWTTDSGSQLHPFGAPWVPPWRGTRGMEGLPLSGTFHVGYTYFGRLVNYTITVTKMPRPGYNLGGTGFDNATLIPVGLRYYGSLVPAEAGQFYRVHLDAGETITVSGFAEGHPSYGSYFSITLFDPSRQPISPDLMDVAAYGPVYFTGGTYTNTGGAGDFYVRIKTTFWPTHDFNFVLKDVGAPDVTFLDPVDELLSGPGVTTDPQVLATQGREVEGIGADGVSQVVLRIQVPTGNQVALTLLNDHNPRSQSSSADEDGGLGIPGGTADQSQITVNTSLNNYAFAIYQAPADFARPSGQDNQSAVRQVYIQLQVPGGGQTTISMQIIRPPVVLVHGLWGDNTTWNTFSPLVTGPGTYDSRFAVFRADYNRPVGSRLAASTPAYGLLFRARENSLGFEYNADRVQFLVGNAVNDVKSGHNPANLLVAAVQADIVAHSMGGDVARAMVLPTAYVNDRTFHEGTIHKLITIDTPHLGSPLATRLLSPEESTGDRCLQGLLSVFRQFVLQDVTFTAGNTVSGAVRDLEPDSPSLQDIARPGGHPLPTAFVTGVYTNFDSLLLSVPALLIRGLCPIDPLVLQLTPTGWPALFRDSVGMFEANDAIVPLSSQENGLSATGLNPFTGYVHSAGAEYLGFSSPSMLDPGNVPTFVIGLLNTTVRDPLYHATNP